jgi:uncharacterized linocin/CFP29 family protein
MSMFDQMRFTTGNDKSPVAGALLRALTEHGEIDVASLRALSPLSDKAQVMVDKAVVEVGLERLTFAADLLAEGLTYSLADPLSVTQVEWEAISKTGGAQRTMSPSARGENQLPKRTLHRIPVYLTTDDFSVGIRTLKMSQRVGQPIDVTLIKQATRRVNEAIEDAAINGATTLDGQDMYVAGYAAPGLLTAPNANTGSLSVDWTAANVVGTTGPAIVNDVLSGISALQADKMYGPYNLYVGTKAGNTIEGDFKVNTTDTIRQRLERIQAGGRMLNIRVADRMPNAATGQQMALVQMTSDVVEMINGQPPTVIPWTSLDGFTLYWLVMAIMIQRVRSDYDGNSGVYLGSKA